MGELWVGTQNGLCFSLAPLGSTELPSRHYFCTGRGRMAAFERFDKIQYLVFCTTQIFFNQDQLAYSPIFKNGKTLAKYQNALRSWNWWMFSFAARITTTLMTTSDLTSKYPLFWIVCPLCLLHLSYGFTDQLAPLYSERPASLFLGVSPHLWDRASVSCRAWDRTCSTK